MKQNALQDHLKEAMYTADFLQLKVLLSSDRLIIENLLATAPRTFQSIPE